MGSKRGDKAWYFVLASFLGLQLSKINAELLATNPGETLPAQVVMKSLYKMLIEPKAFWEERKSHAIVTRRVYGSYRDPFTIVHSRKELQRSEL